MDCDSKVMDDHAAFEEALKAKRMAKFQGLEAESIDNDGWMLGRVDMEREYEAYKMEKEKAQKPTWKNKK